VVSGLAPKVDTARDKIVDELLPRLTEAITAFATASAAAKEEAISRGTGAAAVLSGDASASPKHNKKGRVLLILGLFAAAAAGAMAFMKRSAPKDDPWATPLADPYVAPSTGRHSSVAPVEDPDATDPAVSTASADPDAEPAIIESMVDPDVTDPLDPAADAAPAAKDGKDTSPIA